MSYVFTCFYISRWFRIHSTSAYNLAEGQVVILEGRKLGNYLGGGKKGSCAIHNISIYEKPSIMGNALCCLCKLWFF